MSDRTRPSIGPRTRPPMARLLSRLVHRACRNDVLGDLEADFEADLDAGVGRRRAGIRFVRELLLSVWDSHRHAPRAAAFQRGSRRREGRMSSGSIVRDARFAFRSLARTPGFTAAVLTTLVLGLGGALTMYATARGILRAEVPWPEPDRLVMLSSRSSARWGVTHRDHATTAESASAMAVAAAWQGWRAILSEPGGATAHVAAASVSGRFFEVLNVPPLVGRSIAPEDDQVGRPPVVVLAAETWRRFFAADPDVIGRRLDIDGTDYTVVGVMPPGFPDPINWAIFSNRPVGAWRSAPDVFARGAADPTWVGFWSVGRLRPGVTVEAAAAEVEAIARGLYPDGAEPAFTLVTLRDANTRDVRTTVYALSAAVGALLLIVCVNVANLMLGRGLGRQSELAVRLALGATRGALMRQVLVESLLLATVASLAAVGVAAAGVRLIAAAAGPYALAGRRFGLDLGVLWAAIGLSIVTALLFGLLPAWRASRGSAAPALRESARGGTPSTGALWLRRGLVVAETALACTLLVQAGLLTRSLVGLLAVEPGFETRSAMTIALTLPNLPFADVDRQATTLDAALEAASRTAGIPAAGAISDFPMSGAINSTNTPVVGQTEPHPGTLVRAVRGDYFRAMGIDLVRGRTFGAADDRRSAPVALINATFMERVFDGGDPIGRRVLVRGVEREVVGVVRSVREFGLTGDWDATLYTPYAQEREDWMRGAMTLVARTSAPPASIAAGLRAAVVGATPGLPVGDARPIADHLDRHLALPRLQAGVIAAFAVMAIMLAAVGLAGVMACAVSERLREIAIRLALGARPSDVARLVVGQSLALTTAGVAGGLLLGWWMSRWLAELLVGVEATDAVVFASAAGILLAAGGAASWLPTRRAAAVDPTTALKQ